MDQELKAWKGLTSELGPQGHPAGCLAEPEPWAQLEGCKLMAMYVGRAGEQGESCLLKADLLYVGVMWALREAWSQAASGRLEELQPETLDLCQRSPLPDVSQGGVWRRCSLPQGSHQFLTEDCS